MTTLRDNYVPSTFTSVKPAWHGLGARLSAQADIETWRHNAGLDWEVKKAPVQYVAPLNSLRAGAQSYPSNAAVSADGQRARIKWYDRLVLYRSDNLVPLSVVSDRYQIVQPGEVLEFFKDLTEDLGFQLEVAGTLGGGKTYWAQAHIPADTQIHGDSVSPYLLLATSVDGTRATTAALTAVRAVCANTLTLAIGRASDKVSVPHSTVFNHREAKQALGVVDFQQAWADFAKQGEILAQRPLPPVHAVAKFAQLLDDKEAIEIAEQLRTSNFVGINDIVNAGGRSLRSLTETYLTAPGQTTEAARGTAWGALNAVTRWVDHDKSARSDDSRLRAAWFGAGNTLKSKAWDMLTQ